jgi:hypothetical protein
MHFGLLVLSSSSGHLLLLATVQEQDASEYGTYDQE